MDKERQSWKLNTILNHPPRVDLPPGNTPLLMPIYQAAKFVVTPDLPYHEQFVYTRISNPTLKQLELSLAEVQKKEECHVLASGIAAISVTLLGLLKQGDHVIAFKEMYKPARIFIRDQLPKFGIASTLLTLNDFDALEKSIRPGKTKIIHFESPTNPQLSIADIEKMIAIGKRHNILISMDGTFGGLHQHLYPGIDIMIHSLTKFGNGHGDVMAGSIATSSRLMKEIRGMATLIGATLDPHAAFLIERGLKTYLLRYERQSQTALKVAEFLSKHPEVSRLYYPGLPHHPGHDLAQKQMSDGGGVVSFTLKSKLATTAQAFCHKLKLIQFSVSLGATESIICPTEAFFGDDLAEREKKDMGIDGFTVRLSVGLEDALDIIQDLDYALKT